MKYLSSDGKYIGIDGNIVKNPVAICHYRKHPGYMAIKQIKVHKCLKRECTRLEKLECDYWEERKEIKRKARMNKKRLWVRKL